MDKELIVIGIGTYKRPKMLRNALESLQELKVPADLSVQLVIVDNEANSNARNIVHQATNKLPFKIHYHCEPKRGIVHVRNKILNVANDLEGTYLAFIDDDETASPDWIEELYQSIVKYDAQIVAGKVEYQIPEDCPNWIKERDFYGLKYHKTGDRVTSASTNNVMYFLPFILQHNVYFDEKLNETGSSDTQFCHRLIRKGGKAIWCEEAVTYEIVPPQRLTKSYILERAFKTGFTTHLRNVIRFGKMLASVISLLHVLFFLLKWFFLNIRNGFFRKSDRIFNARQLAIAKGSISAVFGSKYRAYEVIHGE
ncbi:glycosyltransferase [Ekhidna sp.]|uniref:glycosyltransferase n=1 Tax=Ekhidna sp. TaxID=2608089 RepID=UPI003B50D47E